MSNVAAHFFLTKVNPKGARKRSNGPSVCGSTCISYRQQEKASFFICIFYSPRLNNCYGTLAKSKDCCFQNCYYLPTLPPCIHNFSKKSSEVRQNWNISSDPMDPPRLRLRGGCEAALRLFSQGCCKVFAMLLGSCFKGRSIRTIVGDL